MKSTATSRRRASWLFALATSLGFAAVNAAQEPVLPPPPLEEVVGAPEAGRGAAPSARPSAAAPSAAAPSAPAAKREDVDEAPEAGPGAAKGASPSVPAASPTAPAAAPAVDEAPETGPGTAKGASPSVPAAAPAAPAAKLEEVDEVPEAGPGVAKGASPSVPAAPAAKLEEVDEAVDAQEGERIAAPAAPAAKLDLEQCISLGMSNQPALAAARASLAAANSGYRGVAGLRFAALFSRDIPIRRQQACLGITIASAGLDQAEWETRYAVRRTYYSVQYARMQKNVLDGAIEKIDEAYKKAKQLVDQGAPDFKVTTIDLKVLAINKEFLRTKHAEATVGIQKAVAALREAIGVGPDYPLDVAVDTLPALVTELNKEELINVALAQRSELVQALTTNEVTELEIEAQRRKFFSPQTPTFAAGADIHAKPIPQGVANGEYRPGAIGPEMPPFLIGRRGDRMQRAADLNDRAVAVVDKTQNLIALETAATYLKWLEASQNVKNLAATPKMAADVAEDVRSRFNEGRVSGEEYLRARTLGDQAQAMYNDALFQHALALAALERVTAGGYRLPAGK